MPDPTHSESAANDTTAAPNGSSPAESLHSAVTNSFDTSTVDASTGHAVAVTPLDSALPKASAPRSFGDFGDYELLEKIDEGGMGVIYRARHVKALREVALKTMRPEVALVPDQFARFEREIRSQAGLTHPNIVTIYEICLEGTRPYFTMALARGGSLAKRRKEFRDPHKAAALIERVARAVQHAHDHGIFHRDLKPGNILLDENGQPLVADFGLAKDVRSDLELTRTGLAPGTIPYMAPEQAAGKKEMGAPTDVWALGIILYELLAGTRPFAGDSHDQIKHYILNSEPPSLRRSCPGLDRSLEAIVLKCLQKEPGQRYQTAGELAEHLARWAVGDPIPLQREPLARRLWRPLRRRPRVVVACAATFVLVGTLAAVWYRNDPGQRLRSLQRRLARGEAVTLLGSKGTPMWSAWHGSQGMVGNARPELGSAFSVSSSKRCLLELLPDPGTDSFELDADVVQLDSESRGDAEIGIYFGRLQSPSQEMFWSVAFNDIQSRHDLNPKLPKDSVARVGYRVLDRGEEDSLSSREFGALLFTPTVQSGKIWRRIRVEARPDNIRVLWEGQVLATLERSAVAWQYRAFLPFMKHRDEMPSEAKARGGIGLYVSHGEAAYRNVAVSPSLGK